MAYIKYLLDVSFGFVFSFNVIFDVFCLISFSKLIPFPKVLKIK